MNNNLRIKLFTNGWKNYDRTIHSGFEFISALIFEKLNYVIKVIDRF